MVFVYGPKGAAFCDCPERDTPPRDELADLRDEVESLRRALHAEQACAVAANASFDAAAEELAEYKRAIDSVAHERDRLRSALDAARAETERLRAALVVAGADLTVAEVEADRMRAVLDGIEAHAVMQDRIAHEKRVDAPCSAEAHHNAASAIFRALDVVLNDGKRRWVDCLGRWHDSAALDGRGGAE
jgi:chromosome segregation ATPase